MEKIGLYAPAITPLLLVLAVGLGLPGRHGFSLIGGCIAVVGLTCLAFAAFRRIHSEAEQKADL
jgi:hypothetical protein